jgi:hypothetical protein
MLTQIMYKTRFASHLFLFSLLIVGTFTNLLWGQNPSQTSFSPRNELICGTTDSPILSYPTTNGVLTPSTTPINKNGAAFTPRGDIKFFIFFRRDSAQHQWPAWQTIANNMANYLANAGNAYYSQYNQFSITSIDRNVSNILFQNSKLCSEPLRITAYIFPELIPPGIEGQDVGDYMTNYFASNPSQAPLQSEVDSRTKAFPFQGNDISTGPDGKLDYTIEYSEYCGGISGIVGVQTFNFTLPNGGPTLTTGWGHRTFIDRDVKECMETDVHEMYHTIQQGGPNGYAHFAGANNTYGSYFYQTSMYSMFKCGDGLTNFTINAQEREFMGWYDHPLNHDIRVPFPGKRRFTLHSFEKTQEALRIKLPNKQNQWLWLEFYDNSPTILDGRIWDKDANNTPIPPYNRGLRSYIVDGFLINNGVHQIFGNGIKLLSARGNIDANVQQTYREPRIWKGMVSDIIINNELPTSDYSTNGCVRDNIIEIEPYNPGRNVDLRDPNLVQYGPAEGHLSTNCRPSLNWFNEANAIWKENSAWIYRGLDRIAFSGAGKKINIASNPISSLPHRAYNICEERLEPILLNGLSIEIISQTNNEITVEVGFDDLTINGSGYKKLSSDIIIDPSNYLPGQEISISGKISLVKTQGANRRTRTAWDDGFVNPSIITIQGGASPSINSRGSLTVCDNSSLYLKGTSSLTVERGSSLTIKSGASLVVSENAKLNLLAGSSLIIEDGAYVCFSSSEIFLPDPLAFLNINTNFIEGASSAFIGYTNYQASACLRFCIKQELIVAPNLAINGLLTNNPGDNVSYSIQVPIGSYEYTWQFEGNFASGVNANFDMPDEPGIYSLTLSAQPVGITNQPTCSQSIQIPVIVAPRCFSGAYQTIPNNYIVTGTELWNIDTKLDGIVYVSGKLIVEGTNVLANYNPVSSNFVLNLKGVAPINLNEGITPVAIVILNGGELEVIGSGFNSESCLGLWAGIFVNEGGQITVTSKPGFKSYVANSMYGISLYNTKKSAIIETFFYNNISQGLQLNTDPISIILNKCEFAGDGSKVLRPFAPSIGSLNTPKEYWPLCAINQYQRPYLKGTVVYNDPYDLGTYHKVSGFYYGLYSLGDAYPGRSTISNSWFSNCINSAIMLPFVEVNECSFSIPNSRPQGVSWSPSLSLTQQEVYSPFDVGYYYQPNFLPLVPDLRKSIYGISGLANVKNSTFTSPNYLYRPLDANTTVALHSLSDFNITNNTFISVDTAIRINGSGYVSNSPHSISQNRFTDCSVSNMFYNTVQLLSFRCNTFTKSYFNKQTPIVYDAQHPSYHISEVPGNNANIANVIGDVQEPNGSKFTGFSDPTALIINKAFYRYPSNGYSPLTYHGYFRSLDENIQSNISNTGYTVPTSIFTYNNSCPVDVGAQNKNQNIDKQKDTTDYYRLLFNLKKWSPALPLFNSSSFTNTIVPIASFCIEDTIKNFSARATIGGRWPMVLGPDKTTYFYDNTTTSITQYKPDSSYLKTTDSYACINAILPLDTMSDYRYVAAGRPQYLSDGSMLHTMCHDRQGSYLTANYEIYKTKGSNSALLLTIPNRIDSIRSPVVIRDSLIFIDAFVNSVSYPTSEFNGNHDSFPYKLNSDNTLSRVRLFKKIGSSAVSKVPGSGIIINTIRPLFTPGDRYRNVIYYSDKSITRWDSIVGVVNEGPYRDHKFLNALYLDIASNLTHSLIISHVSDYYPPSPSRQSYYSKITLLNRTTKRVLADSMGTRNPQRLRQGTNPFEPSMCLALNASTFLVAGSYNSYDKHNQIAQLRVIDSSFNVLRIINIPIPSQFLNGDSTLQLTNIKDMFLYPSQDGVIIVHEYFKRQGLPRPKYYQLIPNLNLSILTDTKPIQKLLTFKAYPNPVQAGSTLTLDLPNDLTHNLKSYNSYLFSLTGALVLTSSFTSDKPILPIPGNLPHGIYQLQLIDSKGIRYNSRIVVTR